MNPFSHVDYVNGGELFTHLYNREHFTEDHAKFYTAEVGIALDFLHKVCYRSFILIFLKTDQKSRYNKRSFVVFNIDMGFTRILLRFGNSYI